MLDMSAAFIAILCFIVTILTTCGIAYLNADRLEAFFSRKFAKHPSVDKHPK
ncbi:hypothetical protein [Shewanella indica]|uniref:hypothetical protein n=1 Tax=Shewanella indica TaxID=768528 RepID=UPI003006F086